MGEGSTPKSGRLEVSYDGVWGTVCDDNFGFHDADVTCRQLGFLRADAVYTGEQSTFGPGGEDSPIHMDDVACTGDEGRLNECLFPGIGVTNCQHSEDVALTCTDGELQISLFAEAENAYISHKP